MNGPGKVRTLQVMSETLINKHIKIFHSISKFIDITTFNIKKECRNLTVTSGIMA